jgi:anaerobic magnesium-protoporphyrin IX monomethyl ester cyclase
MGSSYIVLIGLSEYDNLGISYITAVLEENGFKTKVIDIGLRKSVISRIIKKLEPEIIGFSIIYQQYLLKFKDLIDFLSSQGIDSHLTAGGHYASLRHKDLLRKIPALDSVVRFEGEKTMLELAMCISKGKEWRNIKGIAYKGKNGVVSNQLRRFEADLDNFPFPVRSPLKEYAFWKKFVTLIAGRGCIYNCSFCNVRKFYSQPPGFIKRIRRPEMVVLEMEMLYNKENCEIFLFLDDDFPIKPSHDKEWILKFCSGLAKSGLDSKIIWKINCRPDEVDENLFKLMKKKGLFSVFIGIEDGTDAGLKQMNKMMNVKACLNAVRIVKKLRLKLDYGFLLFHPYTTFSSL